MNHRISAWIGSVTLIVFSSMSQAVELQQGVQYASGQRITASKPGIGFAVPEQWLGAVSAEGDFIMQSPVHEGMLVITASPSMDQQALINSLNSEPLDLGDGVILQPAGRAGRNGSVLLQNYQGYVNNAAVAGQVRIQSGKYDYMVTIVAVGAQYESAYFSQLVNALGNSVDFFQPVLAANQLRQATQQQAEQQRNETIINQSQNGSVVSGRNSDGQNCTYVSAGGTTFKSCD